MGDLDYEEIGSSSETDDMFEDADIEPGGSCDNSYPVKNS